PSRYSSWAQIWLAISSLTSVPRSTTRFFSSRLNTSARGSTAVSSAWGTIMSAGYRHRPVALGVRSAGRGRGARRRPLGGLEHVGVRPEAAFLVDQLAAGHERAELLG